MVDLRCQYNHVDRMKSMFLAPCVPQTAFVRTGIYKGRLQDLERPGWNQSFGAQYMISFRAFTVILVLISLRAFIVILVFNRRFGQMAALSWNPLASRSSCMPEQVKRSVIP